jgi:hypothetical protein
MQAKGSTARIVVPRDPEVVSELAQELTTSPGDDELLSAEEYLVERGYFAPVDIGLTRGSYSITRAGLDWLGRGFLSPPRPPETATEESKRGAEPRSGAGGAQGASGRRSLWARLFGG